MATVRAKALSNGVEEHELLIFLKQVLRSILKSPVGNHLFHDLLLDKTTQGLQTGPCEYGTFSCRHNQPVDITWYHLRPDDPDMFLVLIRQPLDDRLPHYYSTEVSAIVRDDRNGHLRHPRMAQIELRFTALGSSYPQLIYGGLTLPGTLARGL